jgi:SAM-dependent methyltransferase
MTAPLPDEVAEMFTQQFWDARYRSVDHVWSGKPNPRLVEYAADLTPGTALDAGSGEGADAIWLAEQGWTVTAVDVSPVALQRAAARAAEVGADTARRISWQPADLLGWDPPPQRFDLVSASFIQLPPAALADLQRRLAAAVRPGGTLLVVGHHYSDVAQGLRPHHPELYFTGEQLAAALEPVLWQDVVAAAPARVIDGPDGRLLTIRDAVLRAVRRR